MPPERFSPDDPREWLNRARSNLIRARQRIPGVYPEDLCFDAQQAGEKAVKAVLVQRGVAFPYVHDPARLLTRLEEAGKEIPAAIRLAEGLTRYAVLSRYPGLAELVTEAHYQEALANAETLVNWAGDRVR